MIIKDLGAVTAYAAAVEKGYTGTEEEFATLMASYATVAEEAAESAESASTSATNASASAQTATTKASEASTAAQTATAKAEEAQADADAAALDASQALSAASTATSKASEAAQSASDASTAKTAAQTAQTAAEGSATTAQTAAQTATQKAAEAAESARTLTIDTTLTQSGQAADAKVVGEEIEGVKGDLSETVTKSLLLQGNLVTAYNENKYNGKAVRGWLGSDGELIVRDGYDWMTTDFIYVKDLTVVSASALQSNKRVGIGLYFLCTYDENGTFIEQISDPQDGKYNVDDGVSYIRFSYHQELHTDLCVVGNAYNRDYIDYHQGAMDANIQDNLRSIAKRITTYTQNNDLQDITAEFTLYDGYIQLDGKFVSYNGSYSTDYINIFGCGNLFITAAAPYGSTAHYALYDKSKSFIAYYKGTGTEYEFNVNDVLSSYPNANYVRFASVNSPLVLKRDNTISEILQDLSGLRWTGKKWVCVGDSLTEVNVRTTKHYFDYIADATGITTVNMGLSGSGYAKKADTNQAFYQRISNVPIDADVVTIFGSGNDGSSGLDVGSPTDSGTTTLCGCINTTIDTLIEIIPTVSLGIVAPTPWVGQQPSNTTGWMAQYVDAIKTICEYRSIPFLDLYHSSNLRPWTEEGRAACYSKDEGNGVHPDENGHKLIAPRFKAFLETLII